jgi:hypothetical protein
MRWNFPWLVKRCAIIGVALVLLAGCSAVRLSYNQGPQLAYWWADGYLDFDEQQAPRVKQALEQWFAWHRETQLADYFTLLARARQEFSGPVTGSMACQWAERVRNRLEPAVERALPALAQIAVTLTPAQLDTLQQRYAKNNAKLRKQMLQPDAAERRKASIERTVERFEDFYGPLDEAQRKVVGAGVAESPFNAEAWMAEREGRQREILGALKAIINEQPASAVVQARLRELVLRYDGAARHQKQAALRGLEEYNCNLAAAVHNAASPAQRRQLQEKLLGWEGDLRQLAAESRVPAQRAELLR